MSPLDLTADELLTTTRAVRKRLDFDRPLDFALVRECLEIALQAPSGSNSQPWHFVVVGDTDKKLALAELYRKGFEIYRDMDVSAHALAKSQENERDTRQMERVVDSAEFLAANLEKAPYLVIPCSEGRVDGIPAPMSTIASASQFGSLLPAFWSFMLAARARGLGTSWTTIHLMFEKEAADILGIPYDEVTQAALSPLAYTIGTRFKPARRKSLEGVLHTDTW